MNKYIKGFVIFLSIVIVGFYLSFLFILPKAVDLNQYKPLIVQAAKEQANLDVDCSCIKLITTPTLAVGVKIDDINVKLPDKTILFSSKSVKTNISLPSLLLLTVKISNLDIEKPFVNLEIANDENYKIVKHIESIINADKQRRFGKVKTTKTEPVYLSWIRIKIPSIKLKNYKVLVNDLKTGHYLNLTGEEIVLGYFNGKRAKIKGVADLFSDDNKNIALTFDVNTFLPEFEKSIDEEDDEAVRIEVPFVNPVTAFRKYDLKTKLDTKLRINNKKGQITSFGYLNIDDLTFNVEKIKVPASYMHIKTFGDNVSIDSDINITKNANINLLGKIKYGNHPRMDMNIKTGKIYFNELLDFTTSLLNSLGIKHDLDIYSVNGYVEANSYIKTNFKRLKSNGSITVKDGALFIKNVGKVLTQVNINVLLDGNILDIKKSGLNIGDAKVFVDGSIDNSSNLDVKINTDAVSLPLIFKAFAPEEIRKSYDLKSGNTLLNVYLKGKLKEAVADAEFILKDFNLTDRAGEFVLTNKNLDTKLLASAKTLSVGVENSDFSVYLPKTKSSITVPKTEISIAENNLSVKEGKILFNNNSSVNYKGELTDYLNQKNLSFNVEGVLNTSDIIKILGKDFERYFNYKGQIPLNLSFVGNKRKQTLFTEVLSDNENYITPLDFVFLNGKNVSLRSVIDFKHNRFKIKKTGFFLRDISVDEKGNEKVNLKEVIGIDGTVAGDTINMIKVSIPHSLRGKICMFKDSDFTLGQSSIFIFGKTDNPRFRGRLRVSNISIPEILTALSDFDLRLGGQKANLKIGGLSLNSSVLNIDTVFKILQSGIFELENAVLHSDFIDVDKILKITEKSEKYFPADNTKTSSSDIPLSIRIGNINIKRLKTGNINIYNILSNFGLNKNVFVLNNLSANVFNGRVVGNISVDLLKTLINLNMAGRNIDIEKALADSAGVKNTLSGTADFSTQLSLQGSEYNEQMKSLKGRITFLAKKGQYGPFGKIENLIIAENIRDSEFFQTALGGIIDGLTKIDTTHYDELSGKINFKDGICNIEEITSRGNILMLHIFGDFNLLENTIEMKIRAKMTSIVAELLGPIGAINPIKLLNSAASTNIMTAKAFSLFCETLSEEEINTIPAFLDKYTDIAANANRFQLVVSGDVSKPLTLIKSFKWITTQIDFQKAKDFVASIPEPVENSTATTISEVIAENEQLEKEKKKVSYKIKHLFKKDKKKIKSEDEKAVENIVEEDKIQSENE